MRALGTWVGAGDMGGGHGLRELGTWIGAVDTAWERWGHGLVLGTWVVAMGC